MQTHEGNGFYLINYTRLTIDRRSSETAKSRADYRRETLVNRSLFQSLDRPQSIEHQRLAVENWLTKKNYNSSQVVTFSDEGISGAISDKRRPGYTKLLEGILQGKIKKVIVFETSRLSRDFMTYLNFLQICKNNNCWVEVIEKGKVDFASSEDMLLASISAFIAQAERERIRVRIRSGVKAAKERGVKFGARPGEKRRLGFRKEHDAGLVSEILALHKNGLSLRQIAETLNGKGTAIGHCTVQNILRRHAKMQASN